MKHHMLHALRPPGPHSQGETIPDHSNDPHKLKPQTKDGVSPTPLQGGVTNFLFNTLSISSLYLGQTNTIIRQGTSPGRPPNDPKTPPNRAEAPNRAKCDTPGQTTAPDPY